MPLYQFRHPITGEIKGFIQRMEDCHEFYDKEGTKWERIFDRPQISSIAVNSIDPFSNKDFLDKTRDLKGGTVGDLWDISAELSEKRVKKAGKDEIKEKTVKAYEKKCKGKKHPLV